MNEHWIVKFVLAFWDRLAAIVCLISGAGMVIGGYLGLSVRLDPAEQLPYIMSGGIGGLLLIGVGATLWLSADLRDEWRKLDEIAEVLAERIETDAALDGRDELHSPPVGGGTDENDKGRRNDKGMVGVDSTVEVPDESGNQRQSHARLRAPTRSPLSKNTR